jgi:hypothetical protein
VLFSGTQTLLKRWLRHAVSVTIAGASHDIPITRLRAVAEEIAGILR